MTWRVAKLSAVTGTTWRVARLSAAVVPNTLWRVAAISVQVTAAWRVAAVSVTTSQVVAGVAPSVTLPVLSTDPRDPILTQSFTAVDTNRAPGVTWTWSITGGKIIRNVIPQSVVVSPSGDLYGSVCTVTVTAANSFGSDTKSSSFNVYPGSVFRMKNGVLVPTSGFLAMVTL